MDRSCLLLGAQIMYSMSQLVNHLVGIHIHLSLFIILWSEMILSFSTSMYKPPFSLEKHHAPTFSFKLQCGLFLVSNRQPFSW